MDMKALQLRQTGGPENLEIRDVPRPAPEKGEVRVSLKAAALNRRDYWVTLGAYPGMQLPCISGSDGSGVVDAVGDGVDVSLVGQEVVVYPAREWGDRQDTFGPDFRVLGMPDQGTFAEYICAPATDIAPRPGHLDWHQAAAVPLAGLTAWRAAVTHGEVGPGKTVLITGAGSGVSTFAIQWAAKKGADVFVSSGSADKIEAAKAQGAVSGENYNDEDCYRKLGKAAGGFDVVIDSAGGEALNAVLNTLRPAGRYVFFGATMGNPKKGLEMARLFLKHVRLQGTTMGSPEEFRAMLSFVDEHQVEPVIDEVFAFDDAISAYQRMQKFGHRGKLVLDLS